MSSDKSTKQFKYFVALIGVFFDASFIKFERVVRTFRNEDQKITRNFDQALNNLARRKFFSKKISPPV